MLGVCVGKESWPALEVPTVSGKSRWSLAVPDGSNARDSSCSADSLIESRVSRNALTSSGLSRSKSSASAASKAESTGGQYSCSSFCSIEFNQKIFLRISMQGDADIRTVLTSSLLESSIMRCMRVLRNDAVINRPSTGWVMY